MRTKLATIVDHISDLRRYALVLTRDGHDAEDLVQEALTRAYERRSSFRLGLSIKPWLMTILHNTFVDDRRSQKVRLSEPAHQEIAPAAQEDAVRLAEVRKTFLRLPDEQREALYLVGVEGLTYPEAAQLLGVPEGTVLSRVSRARQTLRAREEIGESPRLRIVRGSDGI